MGEGRRRVAGGPARHVQRKHGGNAGYASVEGGIAAARKTTTLVCWVGHTPNTKQWYRDELRDYSPKFGQSHRRSKPTFPLSTPLRYAPSDNFPHDSQEAARNSSQPADLPTPWRHPIHPVNLSRGHGSSIHEVSGIGNEPAPSTVSHPSGIAIVLSLPLRAIQRRAPRASQCVNSAPALPNCISMTGPKPATSCQRRRSRLRMLRE